MRTNFSAALLFAALLCFAGAALAQTPGQSTPIRTRTSDPASCAKGSEIWGDTSATEAQLKFCAEANTPVSMAVKSETASAVTSAETLWVCSQANGTTCGSTAAGNGWNGNATVSTTISDSNACTTKALPCRTFAGAVAKAAAKLLMQAPVTIYSADAADSGTDCQSPNAVTISLLGTGIMPMAKGLRIDSYPTNLLTIYGNPGTTANAPISATCGSSTRTDPYAIDFDGVGSVRMIGFQLRGYGYAGTADFDGVGGIIKATGGAHVYYEDMSVLGDTADAGMAQTWGVEAGPQSAVALGGTQSVQGGPGVGLAQAGDMFTYDPIDTAAAPTTISYNCATGLTCAGDFYSILGGRIYRDRTKMTDDGAGTFHSFIANIDSSIDDVETYGANGATDCNFDGAGVCVQWIIGTSINATNYIPIQADEDSHTSVDCGNALQSACTVNVQPTVVSQIGRGSHVDRSSSTGFTGVDRSTWRGFGCVHTFQAGTSNFFSNCPIQMYAVNAQTQGQMRVWGNQPYYQAVLNFERSRATTLNGSGALLSGDGMGEFLGVGDIGTGLANAQLGAQFGFTAAANWDATHWPGQIDFYTHQNNNSGSMLDALRIQDDGSTRHLAQTFASLNACGAGNEGSVAAVTDSTVNTWGSTITGGGANHVLAYCDGTAWTVAAK